MSVEGMEGWYGAPYKWHDLRPQSQAKRVEYFIQRMTLRFYNPRSLLTDAFANPTDRHL